MNIQRTLWGVPQVSCVPDIELVAVLPQIGVFVDYKFAFFDASYYHTNGQSQQTSVSDVTFLNGNYAQVKNKKVTLESINFLDNFWYNPPFLNGL
jgi:hypothetical protein